jgi:hypothetical protein
MVYSQRPSLFLKGITGSVGSKCRAAARYPNNQNGAPNISGPQNHILVIGCGQLTRVGPADAPNCGVFRADKVSRAESRVPIGSVGEMAVAGTCPLSLSVKRPFVKGGQLQIGRHSKLRDRRANGFHIEDV